MRLEYFMISIIITLVVFVAFGSTWIAMSTNNEYGYPKQLSSKFTQSYANISRVNPEFAGVVNIGFNMSDNLRDAKIKDANGIVPYQLAREFLGFSVGSYTFAKSILLQVSEVIKIPSIIIMAFMAILMIGIVFAIAKSIFRVNL